MPPAKHQLGANISYAIAFASTLEATYQIVSGVDYMKLVNCDSSCSPYGSGGLPEYCFQQGMIYGVDGFSNGVGIKGPLDGFVKTPQLSEEYLMLINCYLSASCRVSSDWKNFCKVSAWPDIRGRKWGWDEWARRSSCRL